MLTIQQVQTMLSALETNITLQLQAFKEQTGLTIHSVPVVDNGASVGATVKIIIRGQQPVLVVHDDGSE